MQNDGLMGECECCNKNLIEVFKYLANTCSVKSI